MLKAFLIRKAASLALTVAASSVIPWVVYDKPRIKWVWDNFGPQIVETASEVFNEAELER